MTDNATPPKKIRRTRPTLYPASLAIMTTAVQRAEIDAIADDENRSVADVTRELIDRGLNDRRQDEDASGL